MRKISWSCDLSSQVLYDIMVEALLKEIERLKIPNSDPNEAYRKAGQIFQDRSLTRLEQFRDHLTYTDGCARSWIDTELLPHPFNGPEEGCMPGEIPAMVAHQDHFVGDLREIPLQGMSREIGIMMKTKPEDRKFNEYEQILRCFDLRGVTSFFR